MAGTITLATPATKQVQICFGCSRVFFYLSAPIHYKNLMDSYIQARTTIAKKFKPVSLDKAMSFIWNGNQHNRNATLTVFRHYDNASIHYGSI